MKSARTSRLRKSTGETEIVRETYKDTRQVRLTAYVTVEKDFALRYLALKRRTSLNQLVNENLDLLLQASGIDPATLPQTMP
jgi:hypothetical protein